MIIIITNAEWDHNHDDNCHHHYNQDCWEREGGGTTKDAGELDFIDDDDDVDNYDAYILKAGIPGIQIPQTIWIFRRLIAWERENYQFCNMHFYAS